MEQHPVPQNVTTFQFRLIGDMTIKQFGYLAGGAILAYISYKLPLPFFFTWPLALVFGLGGFGFAFVPVEERPMDVWFLSFLKNIYAPTQYIWSHETQPAKPVAPPPAPAATPMVAKKTDVLQSIFTPVAAHVDSRSKKNPFGWLSDFFSFSKPQKTIHIQTPSIAAAIPTPSVTGSHMDLTPPPKVVAPQASTAAATQVAKKQEELTQKAHELQKALEEKTQTNSRILELQKQLTEVLDQRDHMQNEISLLRAKAAPPAAPPVVVPSPPPAGGPHQPTVRIITPEGAIKAGLPRLTTYPNVVTGVTRDADNNLLPGVLVTVKDKDGVPLRALKTNRLGQFAASTPIANGTYLVEVEDPRGRYIFDRVQITLNGSVVPGIEILAKSHRQVSREKLAKEIFGP